MVQSLPIPSLPPSPYLICSALSNRTLDSGMHSVIENIYSSSRCSIFYVGYTARPYMAEKLWWVNPSAAEIVVEPCAKMYMLGVPRVPRVL